MVNVQIVQPEFPVFSIKNSEINIARFKVSDDKKITSQTKFLEKYL